MNKINIIIIQGKPSSSAYARERKGIHKWCQGGYNYHMIFYFEKRMRVNVYTLDAFIKIGVARK
jgi:hypothetical protein